VTFTPYQVRPIRFLELWSAAGFEIKVYGIAFGRETPQPDLLEAAKRLAAYTLRHLEAAHHSAGFLGVHEGRERNFVFLDYWARENELHHHLFISSSREPTALVAAGPADPTACVWDLRLQAFEREAWVKHVLKKPDAPDLKRYFAARLTEEC